MLEQKVFEATVLYKDLPHFDNPTQQYLRAMEVAQARINGQIAAHRTDKPDWNLGITSMQVVKSAWLMIQVTVVWE